ncbi:DUF1217 domain-containing protein [Litorisediminicola beolgyonensis]|uniref:DUF1217 domain-containing protein n=1 Tax=Litorisediminicola beolgyonensis TaxID=1173614 RepID=A0ABW3ZFP2_9RHOB
MMLALGTMSAQTGLRLVTTVEDKAKALIRDSAQHARAIAHFEENIASVNSVDDLMADPDLYAFVMRAYDLEDQIFGKALMSKMLKSDIDDPKALVNRLSDPRFKELYNALQFGPEGENTLVTLSKKWRDSVVEKYVSRQFIDQQYDQNETVGTALEFRQKIGSVENVFDILKDRDLALVVRTALGLPREFAQLDIDKQAEEIKERLDLETLKDPAEVEKLVNRYVLISDAQSGTATAGSAALQMLTSAANYSFVSIDLEAISSLPRSPYR